ncbi:FmdB family transcriptional regulator [Rhizocola hellebori]|uniref:FmdB family transcriptional regulator n=1 Tax=Rhizocola hellebori TaxID=1392758 RepID=A0A8J3VKI4_9ACTN|nr:FmdB family zinc ribbon protein [Rhizocola hellebori]GIH09116.1 FmdB family transcriptional regulator [Rhizocola hellebori]
MPTYQYACTACGHQLEAVQTFADDPLTECPACEGRLRKLFSGIGVVFKGSGFYRTDSRAGASSSLSSSSSSSDGAAKKSDSAKSDSAPKQAESKPAASSASSSSSSAA